MFAITGGIIAGFMAKNWVSAFLFPSFVAIIESIWSFRRRRFGAYQRQIMREEGVSDEDMRQAEQGMEMLRALVPRGALACVHQLARFYIIALIPCVVIAAFRLGFTGQTSLTADEQQDLRYFMESFQEHRLATLDFNNTLDAGHAKGYPCGFGTIPKEVVEDLIRRNEKALQLSRKAKSEVLARVHPELASMVRDHYEKSLQLFAESLRSGDTKADLKAQRHANEFADWWNSHKKDMPLLKKVMNQMREMPNQ